jgi:hypothetical protein
VRSSTRDTCANFLAGKGRAIAQAHPYAVGAAATVGALAMLALINHRLARKAERDNPPAGHFLEVNGVKLHYVERGSGPPLVLLHGNFSMVQDFESSGLIDLAARSHRVIAFAPKASVSLQNRKSGSLTSLVGVPTRQRLRIFSTTSTLLRCSTFNTASAF